MIVKLLFMLLLLYLILLFLLFYEDTTPKNVYIFKKYYKSEFSIGYYPNDVTGLFTKLIGIASVVGLSLLKNSLFVSNFLFII